jgi:hypothetical protein
MALVAIKERVLQDDAPYLRPSSTNRLLLIRPKPDAVEQILDIYLARL